MTTATFILLIILGASFFIMILLGIVVATLAIGILRQVRRITNRAEATTESLSDIFMTVSKKVAPLALSSMAAAILRKFKSKK